MNVFIFIILVMAFLGLIDKILNNRLGLCESFDKGIASMGTLALSMLGFYCIAVTFVSHHVQDMISLAQTLHIDPHIMIGCLLAPDLGGYSIIHTLSNHQGMTVLAGLILTSTIGTVISFQLPLFLTALDKRDIQPYIQGLIYGMVVVPLILIPLGMYLKIAHILIVLLPVYLICLVMILGLLFLQKQTMRFLTCFGQFIRILSLLFFAMVIVVCYQTDCGWTSLQLIQEGLLIVLKCSMIVTGSMILCDLILKYCSPYIDRLAEFLGVNHYSVIGLFLQLATSVAIFPIYSKMDRKGKMLNGAFSVCGAYVLGAQLGFVASVDSMHVTIYICTKLVGGLLAMLFTYFFQKKKLCRNH